MLEFELAALKAGMILAKPVRNAQGQLLVNTGSRLSEKDIYKFKTWGVGKVAVRGKSAQAIKSEVVLEFDVRQSLESELKEKFAEVLDDPVMTDIMDAAKRQLLQTLQKPKDKNECT